MKQQRDWTFSRTRIDTLTLSLILICMTYLTLSTSGCQSTHQKRISWHPQPNEIFEDFQLKRTISADDFKSQVFQFEHLSSGASLTYFQNKDDNKTFSIAFKTPPYDNTGLFHVFEHSVLAGSKKYPSKSLFFSLYGSSLTSNMNASTYPVFTKYYFSSREDKDFFNLLDPYLDAVFYPQVVTNPHIVAREGWRTEFDEQKKQFQYNGIVFSEMKGAFASHDYPLYYSIIRSLLPHTPYAFVSGGDPNEITKLTFAQIQEAHKKYYHPQNSHIFLYGDLDIKRTLSHINKHFLKNFKKDPQFQDLQISLQKTSPRKKIYFETYPVTPGTSLKGRTFMSLNYTIGKSSSLVELLSLMVIASALVDDESSPIKKRIRQTSLAKDISLSEQGTQENILSFIVEGVSSSQLKRQFQNLITTSLKQVAQKGLSKNLVESTLNRIEFQRKETLFNSPHKGLILDTMLVRNWVEKNYDLEELLQVTKQYSKVKAYLENADNIKTLIKKHFINNKKRSLVVLSPSSTKQRQLNKKLKLNLNKRIKETKADSLKKQDQEFKTWLQAKESKEIKETLPVLNPSSLSKRKEEKISFKVIKVPRKASLQRKSKKNKEFPPPIKLYSFPQITGKINYVDFHFDLKHIPSDKLSHIPLILYLLQNINTQKKTYTELSNAIGKNIGDLSFFIETFNFIKTPTQYHPHLVVSAKFLNHKSQIAFDLIKEVLMESLFQPKKQVQNLIMEYLNKRKDSIVKRAPLLVGLSGRAAFLEESKWRTYTSGHMAEIFFKNLEKNLSLGTQKEKQTKWSRFIKQLENTSSLLFNQNNLRLAVIVSEKEDLKLSQTLSTDFISKLNHTAFKKTKLLFSDYKPIQGFIIPSRVQHVYLQSPYFQLKKEFSGKMLVYSRIVTFEYLLKVLREQGGAYGAQSSFSTDGVFSLSTFEDPQLEKTYRTFESLPQFVNHFLPQLQKNKKKLNQFIVGSLKEYYKAQSPYSKVSDYISRMLSGLSEKEFQNIKKEILDTKVKDIENINTWVKTLIEKNSQKSLAGGKEKLKQEALFLTEKNTLTL